MKAFHCSCGNTIFFENSQCTRCGAELGWCPTCRSITSLFQMPEGGVRCGHAECGARLSKCRNYDVEKVCNRCLPWQAESTHMGALCDYCRFNDTIPDLTIAGNREKWARLEAAKRRLLYTLDLLQLPYGRKVEGFEPDLSFDFKADIDSKSRWWWVMGREERVYTGHANGKITINIREADPVELEKTRVQFHEAHRTVIGHFRHEIGHYYWQMLVLNRSEEAFKAVFGDHENPNYTEAQRRYYSEGPKENWRSHYISAYASMHPWEDFAETFASYLDMVSVLDTAMNMGLGQSLDPLASGLSSMVDRFVQLGLVLNEMNRALGLLDYVPEVFTPCIVAKMEFVHNLLARAGGRPSGTGTVASYNPLR